VTPPPGARFVSAYHTRTFLGDVLAWVAFLLLGGGGAVAWYFWTHRPLLQASDARAGVAEPRILALSYDRVVGKPDGRHMDQARLRQQLEALRADGFHAVTLGELARFYRGEWRLPAKSLLLCFEHGYLSTAFAADPVLRDMTWPGVMLVMTERQERRDPFFVYWPQLRRMVDSGLWEVASHGHQGHNPVKLDAGGGEGPFFVRRAWLEGTGREETWHEFALRLRQDHERARATIEERLGRKVIAYAPPLKDIAVATLDPELHRSYESTVRGLYALAFVDDLFGVNDRHSDPLHIKRLAVAPHWSAEELTARVRHALGERGRDAKPDELLERLWVAGSGAAQLVGDELIVTGNARADLWRAGSQWAEDWMLEADLRIDGGQLWVVQQSADLSDEWRWGGDERRSYLQRRRPAQTVETLESYDAGVEPGRTHHLRVVRRGTGLWVELDGRPVAERPSYLPDRWRGNVGLVTWGGGQPARLSLTRLAFSALPYRTRALDGRPSAGQVQAAIRDAVSISALSPRWLAATSVGLKEEPVDRDLLAILARRYGWEIVPLLKVEAGAGPGIAAWLPAAFARAEEEGWSGLELDVSEVARTDLDELVAWASRSSDRDRRGLRLVVDVPPPQPFRLVADGPFAARGGPGRLVRQ
jgi:hypothetical protein